MMYDLDFLVEILWKGSGVKRDSFHKITKVYCKSKEDLDLMATGIGRYLLWEFLSGKENIALLDFSWKIIGKE